MRDGSVSLVADRSSVGVPELLSGDAVGLTGKSRNDAIHDSAPRSTVERGEVRPDRRVIQASRVHERDQLRAGECFPLDVTNRASLEHCSESNVVHSDSGADGDDAHRRPGTWSHIHAYLHTHRVFLPLNGSDAARFDE